MKQPTTENSDIIKLVAILGDFALLNLSMILVFFILKGIDSQAIAHISLKTYLLTSNLCYIPCISIFGVILHNRIVRPETDCRPPVRNNQFACSHLPHGAGHY